MNTQLKNRTSTDTKTNAPAQRPRPVWSDPDEGAQPSQPTRRTGRRFAAVVATVAVAAAAAVGWAVAGDNPDPAPDSTYIPAFDSPGGNSLRIPAREAPVQAYVPAFDSPGGNSLRIP